MLLLATACGTAAANLYYAQPLLHTLATAFGVSNGTAGLLITISQLGYVVGLALLVPLGDLRERRGLISATMLVTAAALVLAAVRPAFAVLGAALAVVGVTSVVAQIVVPMSSSLAAEHERGSVVGTVMSGLLIGILLARTVSGLIAAAFGWRVVFWFAAAAMVILAATLRRALPRVPPTTDLSYGGLLRSVLALVREEPVLRQRMMVGALTFGCFSALWTSLAFLLSGAPLPLRQRRDRAVRPRRASSAPWRPRAPGASLTVATTPGPPPPRVLIMFASWGVLALGKTSVVALHRRHRPARPGRPGRAHLQPERDLRAAPRGPQPADHRVHGRLLPGRRRAVGGQLGAVRRRRVGRRLRPGCGRRRWWRWSAGSSPRRQRAGAPAPARAVAVIDG